MVSKTGREAEATGFWSASHIPPPGMESSADSALETIGYVTYDGDYVVYYYIIMKNVTCVLFTIQRRRSFDS
jgi:hypothetical protein